MRIVVLGSSGQLGRALQATQKNKNVIYLSRQQAPFENYGGIEEQLKALNPTHVINTVAYTKVDQAEKDKDLCFLINSETPVKIALWCKKNSATFVHYSTDYVFDGTGERPWTEESIPNPLNVYGASKLESEKGILAVGNSYVFRTSWIYSEFGHNFVKTMVKLFQQRDTLRIVDDQIGAPNYAIELAKATWSLLEKPESFGLYHLSAPSYCSWYEFAIKIKSLCEDKGLKIQTKEIFPIRSNDYRTEVARPLNSRLSSDKLEEKFGITLPHWEVSLSDCIAKTLKERL